MGWREEIAFAIRNLGGSARLTDIYSEVGRIHGQTLTPNQNATVRHAIEAASSDSQVRKPGAPDWFSRIDSGHWALREGIELVTPRLGEIPEGVTREDVLSAIAELDKGLPEHFGPSTLYDLVFEEKRYPPKATIGLAVRRVLGRPMKGSEFGSGEESAAFRILRLLGFHIERKAETAVMPETPSSAIWFENTKTSHNHGGEGWEYGTCLWSPTTDVGGGDRYAPMREVAVGDLVIHANDSILSGYSYVASPHQELTTQPPEPGDWGGRPAYFKVSLRDYCEFPRQTTISEFLGRYAHAIRDELATSRPPRYPFVVEGSGTVRTVQGGYVTRCTPSLYALVRECVYGLPSSTVAHGPLCLLGSGGNETWTAKAKEMIAKNGACASWWSFVLKEDAAQQLPKPFYLYVNSGKGVFRNRLRCEEVVSSRGSQGIVSPWPAMTLPEEQNRTSFGEKQSEICKTWFKVTAIEALTPPMHVDQFIPAGPWSTQENWLNQNAFGYAHEVNPGDPMPPAIELGYTIDDALQGAFVNAEVLEEILFLLRIKKNLVLQGSPGVGKTFLARRIAYALCEAKASDRIELVQFHQSYAYEDFVQGFRPRDGGGFERRNGVFYRFCEKAKEHPDKKYVFLIDEINRGNLSKIFGELMLLIESDKRGADWGVSLTYADDHSSRFYIPENVHLLGMMNTADRSLALVDYALRRRFAFVTIEPAFESATFRSFLDDEGVPATIVDKIVGNMAKLNRMISDDRDLGDGFRIGHSYFCSPIQGSSFDDWYERIIRTEIAPLIREYWFDKKPQELAAIIDGLL